jgi:membrane protein DedA with SNARE-associated domain
MTHFLTDAVANYGYLAIFLLMAASTACIPVPSEAVLLFGGALASPTFAATALGGGPPLNLFLVIVAATLGTLTGSWIAYGIGYLGGRRLVDRAGKVLLFRPDEVDRAHIWFERHGDMAVMVARVVPVVRAFISLPAGVARMSAWRFTLYTLIGALTWDVALTVAGYYLGESWRTVEKYMTPISIAIAVLVVAAVTWWIVRRVRGRRTSATGGPDASGPQSADGDAGREVDAGVAPGPAPTATRTPADRDA